MRTIYGDPKAGQLLGISIIQADKCLCIELEDRYFDALAFGNKIEDKYCGMALIVPRLSRRLFEDMTFNVWKLGAWSTVRLDALERMNEEQTTHWLGGQP